MELPHSLEDYVWARGSYLRTEADYADQGDAIWLQVRSTADLIYTDVPIQALPVTVIFARETAHGVHPRTPLEPRMISLPLAESAHTRDHIRSEVLESSAVDAARTSHETSLVPPHKSPKSERRKFVPSSPRASMTDGLTLPTSFSIGADTSHGPITTPAPGVSSMSNRAVYAPIKSNERPKRTRTANKHAAPPLPDEIPPSKKPRKSTMKSAASEDEEYSVKSKPIRSTKGRDTRPIVCPPRLLDDPLFLQVVDGHVLPLTRDEAVFAQTERKRRLIEAHMATAEYKKNKAAFDKSKKASKGKKKNQTTAKGGADYVVDLMPEFFERVNFPKGEDAVRCACGQQDDEYDTIWIACDTCKAWQHSGCMGDAVPANLEKDPYHCHVCDPWGHRELLQELRRDGQVSGKRNAKKRKAST